MRASPAVPVVALVGLVALPALAEDGLPLPARSASSTSKPSDSELAAAYAPTIYQDIDDSKHHGRPDIPIRLDFDGNTRGDDNWDNFDAIAKGERCGDLGANVYWAVTETDTHYYINYSLFYPQDWDDHSGVVKWFGKTFSEDFEHENDLQTLLVVVEKTPGDPLGRMVLLETEAHNVFHVYGDASKVGAGTKEVEGPILADGRHPRVFVESKGHGIYGKHETLETGKFPGKDGVVFRPGSAADPFAGGEIQGRKDSSYGLRSTRTDILPFAHAATGDGRAADDSGRYRGGRFASPGDIAFRFQGREHKDDAANFPWGVDEPDDGVARGDWFLDPALAVTTHVRLPGTPSLDYAHNPYLDAIRKPRAETKPTSTGFLRRLGRPF